MQVRDEMVFQFMNFKMGAFQVVYNHNDKNIFFKMAPSLNPNANMRDIKSGALKQVFNWKNGINMKMDEIELSSIADGIDYARPGNLFTGERQLNYIHSKTWINLKGNSNVTRDSRFGLYIAMGTTDKSKNCYVVMNESFVTLLRFKLTGLLYRENVISVWEPKSDSGQWGNQSNQYNSGGQNVPSGFEEQQPVQNNSNSSDNNFFNF